MQTSLITFVLYGIYHCHALFRTFKRGSVASYTMLYMLLTLSCFKCCCNLVRLHWLTDSPHWYMRLCPSDLFCMLLSDLFLTVSRCPFIHWTSPPFPPPCLFPPHFHCSATSAGGGGGQMKRMYSAVPGRVYVATRAHSASGDRELALSKGDKVKGEGKIYQDLLQICIGFQH